MTDRLRARSITKRFGGLAVAQDISFALSAGERVALIGPNGAGKTTFVGMLAGAIKPSAGAILLDGVDVTALSDVARARRGLIRTFQASRLFPDFTVREHVLLALLQRDGHGGRMMMQARRSTRLEAEADAALTQLGLEGLRHARAGAIAYGHQRLLEIAVALSLRPRVLLLDEPAAGVSLAESPRILAALEALPADLAVLMIEHDMDLVLRFATRVVVLAGGAVIAEGSCAAVMADANVQAAYLGSYADARRIA